MTSNVWPIVGTVAAAIMPLFNLPLIWKIVRRKSSKDISLLWLFGIWTCALLMVPQVLLTNDTTLKTFGLCNFFLFSGVVIVVLKYRKPF